ncbi:efflux RND transporter periplasmic adaptor subunit [Aureibaculum conchae]|uniref:efflux RND transporter periplasmic adaptor subunit n=1 Tax=Aureibaculum sp. 2308TA14-22 TaxID=3108392 RepID=UPI003390CAC8
MKNLYIVLITLLYAACGNSEKQANDEATISDDNKIMVTKAQFESEKMELGTFTEQDFNKSIKVNGMIDVPPQNRAKVSTFLGGYIKRTPLLVGDKVKKGQLLVTLENTEFVEPQQQYAEIMEQLNYLKSEYERQKTLFDERITSQKNYLQAESTYKSAMAQSSGLRQKLRMMNINPKSVEEGNFTSQINIYAPIGGKVSKVNVSNGMYVSPADHILEIVDTQHLHLELTIFEKDILKIKKEQLVLYKIPEASDKTFKADVHLVGTTVDEANRTVKVHAHLENEDANLIVGMFAEAQVIIEAQKSMALPIEAVGEIGNDFYALVLNEKVDNGYVFEKIKLKVGEQTEAYAEILNSETLKGKKILTNGAFMLLNEG